MVRAYQKKRGILFMGIEKKFAFSDYPIEVSWERKVKIKSKIKNTTDLKAVA